MSLFNFNKAAWFVLEAIINPVDFAKERLRDHLTDSSLALSNAMTQAVQSTWNTINIAITGGKLQKNIRSATIKRAIKHIEQYLREQNSEFQGKCARQFAQISPYAQVQLEPPENILDSREPQQLFNNAEHILIDNIMQLQTNYPEFVQLLLWKYSELDKPLFLTLFAYFLRDEIIRDPHLKQLIDIRQPLDLNEVSNRLPEDHSVRNLLKEKLGSVNAISGVVQRSLSCSLSSSKDRESFEELLQEYRTLPTLQQIECTSTLNGLGKLAIAVGNFKIAQEFFEEAANNLDDEKSRAEAFYNQYCAAVEDSNWSVALEALRKAVDLDGVSFQPFSFKRFEIKKLLGAGGFGTVFLCEDKYLNRLVVIKSLQRELIREDIKKVFHEAHLLSELNHPSIVTIIDCNFADIEGVNRPYLVMEYVDGKALQEYLEESNITLTAQQGRQLAMQLAEALQAAHRKGILHLDVKPANVLVKFDNDDQHGNIINVKLIDFGLGLKLETVHNKQGHASILGRSAAGTAMYAAPEQMVMNKKIGVYSDVYGFGKTLCYALSLQTILNQTAWQRLEKMDKTLSHLLSDCVEPIPDKRPSISDIISRLQHSEIEERNVLQDEARYTSSNIGEFQPEQTESHISTPVLNIGSESDFGLPKRLLLFGIVVMVLVFLSLIYTQPSSKKPNVSISSNNIEKPELVVIPKGNVSINGRDIPVHEFRMSKYEITAAQFRQFVEITKYSSPEVREDDNSGCNSFMKPSKFALEDKHPVVCISWVDAIAYAAWLSSLTGERYRLPTIAEWKRAMADMLDEKNSSNYHDVRKSPNIIGTEGVVNHFGLYHMRGNVAEWTCSKLESSDSQCADDVDGERIILGEAWSSEFSSTDNRIPVDRKITTFVDHAVGFRLVVALL